jgi:hypothetical protein
MFGENAQCFAVRRLRRPTAVQKSIAVMIRLWSDRDSLFRFFGSQTRYIRLLVEKSYHVQVCDATGDAIEYPA